MNRNEWGKDIMSTSFKMLAVVIVLFLMNSINSHKVFQINEERGDIVDCVANITRKYLTKGDEITYFDANSDDDKVIQAINDNIHVSLISRTYKKRLKTIVNKGYIIFTRNVEELINKFIYFTRESQWNPNGRFLIIIKSLVEAKLEDIFNILLKFHVVNVVVVNGTSDCDLYTYNPFENYGCGKHFTRIIHYGKCRKPAVDDIFPNKLTTGFRNCLILIVAPHWPPYSIDPNKNITAMTGIEQYMFQIISELENFELKYIFGYNAENFTTVNNNMSAVGSLALLQNNKVDVIIGGMMLINSRADAFDYIWGHLAYVDDLRFVVKRATDVAIWRNIYLEFQPTVWALLILTFVIYSIIFFALFSVKDKNSIMLKMWDSFFQHGHEVRGRFPIRCFFIAWIWFAFLVNSYYQSSLVSLSTHPVKDYQISKEEDLHSFNLKACISPVIQKFQSVEGMKPYKNVVNQCNSLTQSMTMVSRNEDMFTIILKSIYSYNKHRFYDEWGVPSVYCFPNPLSKIIYGIYMYKGFPIRERLHILALRLRENGLLEKIKNDLYHDHMKTHSFHHKPLQLFLIIPWRLYLFGICLSLGGFFLELAIANKIIRYTN
ncbi:uncharacterized protein LOC113513294 [Galleria mellonella]|uniref:Uncharacterized protein LOC113513294 n=1 Tax=Galleria mellonella TaxID=7137 RepID=A0A6J1WGF4_GALME|nr:uncharacterized protein LOC113513294 [Galleria mellonella]